MSETKENKKGEDNKEKEDSDKKSVKTFPCRYCPGDPTLATRHKAIQAVYESEIAPKVAKQSSFQAGQFFKKVPQDIFLDFRWLTGRKLKRFCKTDFHQNM